jgi:hypothetical protein
MRMTRVLRPLILAALAGLLLPCGRPSGPAATPGDGGTSDPIGVTVRIASPSAESYVANALVIQIAVEGPADSVELLRDGQVMTVLTPPYQYGWNVSQVPEGTYKLVARARRGARSISSDPLIVHVKRTPPVLIGQDPGPSDACWEGPLQIAFDGAVALPRDSDMVVEVDGVVVERTIGLSADKAKVLITPAAAVRARSDVRATLHGVADFAGNIASPVVVTWKFGDWCLISDALELGKWGWNPSVALLPDGTALIGWAESGSTLEALTTQIAASRSGQPLARAGFRGGGEVSVGHLGGVSWMAYVNYLDARGYAGPLAAESLAQTQLGGPFDLDPLSQTGYPALAFDADKPVIAFVKNFSPFPGSPAVPIHVVRWDGADWKELGGCPATMQSYVDPPVIATAAGAIFIAWTDYVPPSSINANVARWDGQSWQVLGPIPSAGNARGIAVDSAGVLYVAALDELFVRRGSQWTSLGDFRVNPYGYRTSTALAIDSDGHPVVAWTEAAAPQGVWVAYLRRWVGPGWSSPIGPITSTKLGRQLGRVALTVEKMGMLLAWDARLDGTESHVGAARINP